MNQSLKDLVRHRAGGRCEYCRIPEQTIIPFESDHIIAERHGGKTLSENLALACYYCNSAKGPNIASIDPDTGKITRLFHPRKETWEDHFVLRDHHIHGKTAVGRTTVFLLEVNHFLPVLIRRAGGFR